MLMTKEVSHDKVPLISVRRQHQSNKGLTLPELASCQCKDLYNGTKAGPLFCNSGPLPETGRCCDVQWFLKPSPLQVGWQQKRFMGGEAEGREGEGESWWSQSVPDPILSSQACSPILDLYQQNGWCRSKETHRAANWAYVKCILSDHSQTHTSLDAMCCISTPASAPLMRNRIWLLVMYK